MAPINVEEFLKKTDLSRNDLKSLRKDDLKIVCDHLKIEVAQGLKKSNMIDLLASHMKLSEEIPATADVSNDAQIPTVSGEIQLQLAKFELEKERMKLEFEEKQKQREMEEKQMEFQLKMREMELAHLGANPPKEKSPQGFDVTKNIRLVPKFDEEGVDAFFVSFEKVAKRLDWPTEYWTLLLQSALVGKAAKIFSSLSEEQSCDYAIVKNSILNAYELVPEAYRQKFRNRQRKPGETYVEFAREQEVLFDKWYRSLKVTNDFAHLREVILLEEFKKGLPFSIKSHLDDQGVASVSKAAMRADEFEVMHKGNSESKPHFKNWNKKGKGSFKSHGKPGEEKGTSKGKDTNESQVSAGIEQTPKSAGRSSKICSHCHKQGHLKESCWELIGKPKSKKDIGFVKHVSVPSKSNQAAESVSLVFSDKVQNVDKCFRSFLHEGEVSQCKLDAIGKPIVVLRDTGSARSLMDQKALPPESKESATGLVEGISLTEMSVPLHEVELKCDLVSGPVTVGVVPRLPMEGVDFLLGNDLAGDKVVVSPVVLDRPVEVPETERLEDEFPGIFPDCAVTRSQARIAEQEGVDVEESDNQVWLAETFMKDINGDIVGSGANNEVLYSRSSLVEAQQVDPGLKCLFQKACSEAEAKVVPECYYVKNDILMRKWRPSQRPADAEWCVVHQIVVPPCYRTEILKMAHELPMAGHVGIRKTEDRITRHFYWPKMHQDVVQFCKTCHTCQIIGKSQPSIKPAPLIPIPAFDEPFTRILVDCVGPLPRTRSGHKYLLTIMDLSSRFPEAIPLRSITAKTVVQALVQFFTRYGLPKEVQSDQGSNFMSGVFQQVMHELGIKQFKSTAYHPQSQGALERYHQTLKTMLRAYCEEYPDDWDKGIPFLLFATRDSPNESTGFSPFELVYGHEVRGPLKLVKERFLAEDDEVNLLDYVSKFRERLSGACEVAKEHLKISQGKMKAQADKNAKERSFKPGDKVLVLLPLQGEPLKARFSGPYLVKKKLNDVNYVISTPDRRKSQRVCHVNMLKEYFDREASQPVGMSQANVVQEVDVEKESENTDSDLSSTEGSRNEPCGVKLSNSEVIDNLNDVLKHLPESQRNDICGLLKEYPNVCKDKPGCTPLTIHDVEVGDVKPIKQHPYRLNPSKLEKVNEEIQYMLDNDIIEPSQSSWSSPIVMVPKPDGSQRFCIDYRKVNAVTKTDSYPIPRLEDCIDKVGNAEYVTKIDLLKGYWQVPLTDRAKEISAFVTPGGLYQCKVMPFGMKNAPATFQRLTNQMIAGLDNCVVYIDDILVYSDTWDDHIDHLRALFDRLDKANLVVNLAKSEFGKAKVTYLGHVVGQGHVLPREAKIQAILEFPIPKTKKELLRFLGMSGFYRKFVENYSTVVSPLTNLLKAKVKFIWSDECQRSFEKLKAILVSEPVLAAPNFTKPFHMAIDASDVGVGAVLLQENREGIEKPVCYFSKKLNQYQKKYSTIEKEALSLVLALQQFEVYLTSSDGDITIYTDHNPLVFLEKFKTKNQRLYRWSLMLQPFPLKIVHIKGKNNVIADALSRV